MTLELETPRVAPRAEVNLVAPFLTRRAAASCRTCCARAHGSASSTSPLVVGSRRQPQRVVHACVRRRCSRFCRPSQLGPGESYRPSGSARQRRVAGGGRRRRCFDLTDAAAHRVHAVRRSRMAASGGAGEAAAMVAWLASEIACLRYRRVVSTSSGGATTLTAPRCRLAVLRSPAFEHRRPIRVMGLIESPESGGYRILSAWKSRFAAQQVLRAAVSCLLSLQQGDAGHLSTARAGPE